jgi:hypothetical protein
VEGSRRHRIAHTGGGRRISLSVTQGVQFTVLGERPPEALKARFAVLQLYNNLCRLCLPLLVRGPTAMNKWRIVTVGVFGWEIAHEAVSRRPPISLYTMVPWATRTTLGFGICPSFKDHSLSPRAKPQRHDSHLFRRGVFADGHVGVRVCAGGQLAGQAAARRQGAPLPGDQGCVPRPGALAHHAAGHRAVRVHQPGARSGGAIQEALGVLPALRQAGGPQVPAC